MISNRANFTFQKLFILSTSRFINISWAIIGRHTHTPKWPWLIICETFYLNLQLKKWNADNKFEFLEGGSQASEELAKILTPAETQSRLLQLMNSDESFDCIKGWVQVIIIR